MTKFRNKDKKAQEYGFMNYSDAKSQIYREYSKHGGVLTTAKNMNINKEWVRHLLEREGLKFDKNNNPQTIKDNHAKQYGFDNYYDFINKLVVTYAQEKNISKVTNLLKVEKKDAIKYLTKEGIIIDDE